MHTTARRSATAASILASALALAGCSGPAHPQPARPTVAHWPVDDAPGVAAPTRFGPAGPAIPYRDDSTTTTLGHDATVLLGQNGEVPLALVGTTAYVREAEDLLVVDTGSGRTLARVAAPWPTPALVVNDDRPKRGGQWPPTVTTVNGRQVVVAAWLAGYRRPGASTLSEAAELAVVDARTYRVVQKWRTDLPVWADLSGGDGIRIAGVSGGTAVVSLTGDEIRDGKSEGREVTFGVDLASGRLAWSRPDYAAEVTTDATVVGVEYSGADQAVAALDPSSGRARWARPKSPAVSVEPAGPVYVVTDEDTRTKQDAFAVVDAATGRTTTQLQTPADPGIRSCAYDGESTTVCSSVAPESAFALDARSGAVLWGETAGAPALPVDVTAVWHGHFYGRSNTGAAAVWDARTGERLDVRLPDMLEPAVLDGQVLVDLTDPGDGRIHAHQVVG